MTWVRLDDAAALHPKLLVLSDGAFRLWINGLSLANRTATNGRIAKALVRSLNHHGEWTQKQLSAFVDELSGGLWIDRGDHYEIHDYAHHQAEALKERVERRKEYERDKKRRQREEADRRRFGVPADVPTGQDTGQTGEAPREASVPIPTRPDPTNFSIPQCVTRAGASVDAETVRAEYLTRWSRATDRHAPLIARGPGGAVWLELARELSGPDEIGKLLDAAFADDFVTSTGWTPAAIRGSAQRLLATGPKRNTERGMVRAATAAEHAADADDELPLEEQLKRFQRRGGHA